MADTHGRKIVTDLLDDIDERVYPVGRLDKDSEGLLILTNDGALANAVMHPSRHIKKRYRVTVRGEVTDDKLTTLASGVKIDTGVHFPAPLRYLPKKKTGLCLNLRLPRARTDR